MIDFDKIELDEEERELEASFERGEWRSVKSKDAEIERYKSHARSHSDDTAGDSDEMRTSPPAPGPVHSHGLTLGLLSLVKSVPVT